MTATTIDIVERYDRDGFVFPVDIVDTAEAATLRADLEAGEAELAGRPEALAMLRSYTDRLLPSFDALTRHPRLIDAASQILGPDLLVWSGALFLKEANTPSFVTWHQDLTYWGLDDTDEITAWFALSPATVESGCMRFMPGSHRDQLVPHVDSFSENNLLTRGQEVAIEVDEDQAVDVVLKPGQASLHHGHLIHASGPNRSDDRRIGIAIRYIKPSMKQRGGDRTVVSLVSGEDRHGNFTLAGPPKGRLHPEDFALCQQDMDIKRRVLYEGAGEDAGGQRYR